MAIVGASGDARMEDAAGFLRRLSVADAKVLLERTRCVYGVVRKDRIFLPTWRL